VGSDTSRLDTGLKLGSLVCMNYDINKKQTCMHATRILPLP
jgi:hypothetical protein